MTYYIYKITNNINNKIYIGKTSNPKRRWYHHCYIAKQPVNKYKKYPIHHAIYKYKESNFKFEIIDQTESKEEIFQKEIQYILNLRNQNFKLYNITNGGEGVGGYIHSNETRQKISRSNKGKLSGNKHPMFGKGNTILGINNPFYGKKHSDDTKNKMSKKRTGSKNPRAKLDEKIVKDIKNNINNLSAKELADLYQIKTITIYKILDGTIWTNIK